MPAIAGRSPPRVAATCPAPDNTAILISDLGVPISFLALLIATGAI